MLIPFFAFRAMVGIGVLMILFGWVGAWLWRKGTVFESRRWLWIAQYTWPAGFIAILSGWFVTEVGRQPWLATGIIRSADAVSPVTTLQVAISLALFVCVYSVVFTAGTLLINLSLIHIFRRILAGYLVRPLVDQAVDQQDPGCEDDGIDADEQLSLIHI